MVLADERRAPKRSHRPGSSRIADYPAAPTDAAPTRADALRRIAAEVSGRQDVAGLFEDVLGEAVALFGVDRAGLWLYDPAAATPLSIDRPTRRRWLAALKRSTPPEALRLEIADLLRGCSATAWVWRSSAVPA